MQILTIGGSHTNCFLRQVIAGTRCIVEGPMNVNGFLNMQHMCVNRPELKIALQRGLKYFIVHWQAAWAWPALADFMQDSLNVEAKLDQSEIEVMLKMHKLFTTFAKANPQAEIPWKQIETSAAKSMPICGSWIKVLSKFVQEHAGGISADMLTELAAFAKSLQGDNGPKRLLGSEFLNTLNNLSFGQCVRFPLVIL